jgi:uncharacterized protein (TIGR03118 family)
LFCPRTTTETIFSSDVFSPEFSLRVATMKTISFCYHSARVGRSLTTALFVAGLQLLLAGLPVGSLRAAGENDERNAFTWTNLQSDIAGVADRTDPNLVNSWGLTLNGTQNVFWVADNGSGVSTLYRPDGTPVPNPNQPSIPLVVTIPPTAADTGTPPSASPTGIVFNPSGSAFPLLGTGGKPAIFIFDAEDGAISGWNPTVDLTHAKTAKDNSGSGAVYKGLAIGTRSNGSLAIYATNFRAGTVDAFDSSFNPITLGFVDPSVPTGYAPFGIANIDNKIYVTFALQNMAKHDDVSGPGHGFVDVFTTDGGFIKRLIPFVTNPIPGPLNSPWGLARVLHEFGEFDHNVLLVGNFGIGDGKINAFDINTGQFLGPLKNRRGEPLAFNGLWALVFLDDRLYFTAGIGDESHGLFGFIRATKKEDSR